MKRVTQSEAWTGIADCRSCMIRNSVLFAGLEERDFEAIHRPINQWNFPPGAQIYGQGEGADSLLTIRSGLVKLTQFLPDGTQRIVRLLCTADTFGLEALVAPEYEHTATALHETQICRIPVETVRQLSGQKPRLYNDLMERWHKALSDADRWIIEFCTGPARARVGRLLIWLAERNAADRCELFGREDLGALLGLTTETVSRVMAEFKRQGHIVEVRPNHFECRLEQLRQVVC
ncbi:MAG: Crp/Fnr family transcriptional regulator [Alphaproteobacteria bacterium]|nr:Crp/Fnr family transcriptional regulator [Alphaproteobacteria bacterium]